MLGQPDEVWVDVFLPPTAMYQQYQQALLATRTCQTNRSIDSLRRLTHCFAAVRERSQLPLGGSKSRYIDGDNVTLFAGVCV